MYVGAGVLLAVAMVEVACAFAYGSACARRDPSEEAQRGFRFEALRFCLVVYVGTIGIAWLLSLAMDQAVLYYRYLTAAIGPVLLVIVFALTSIRGRRLKTRAMALIVALAVAVYGAVGIIAYNPENEVGPQRYEQLCEEMRADNGGVESLVFSDDVITASIVGACSDGAPVVYTDPSMVAYRALEPGVVIDQAWESRLDGYSWLALFIGAPETAEEFAGKFGGTVLESESYEHPYSSNWLIYSVIEF